MKNLNWKQIGLGVITDIGLWLLFSSRVVIFLYARESAPNAVKDSAIEQTLLTAPFLFLFLTGGLSTLLLGTYIAAGRSNSQKEAVTNALVAAVISTVIVILIYWSDDAPVPLWYNVLSYGLILPVALLGGLWRWRNLQRQHRVLEPPQSPLPEVPRR